MQEQSDSDNETDIAKISAVPFRLRLKRWLNVHKKLAIPAVLVIVIAFLAAIPFSRYHLAALGLKKDYTVRILDATTGIPVSGAQVSVGSAKAKTDAYGQARLHLSVGLQTIKISKKYYQAAAVNSLVPILAEKHAPDFRLVATGRQVELKITNLISKQSLVNVTIEAAGVSAKTDKDGQALLVLPAGTSRQTANLSLDGYNDAHVTISVSADKIAQNNFDMTPTGKVYFLKDAVGKLDVMKSNLDGSGAEVVIAGTGHEDINNTILMHSDDWHYLALLAKRDSDPASLYVINTADDQLLTMDQGNEIFTPIGWDRDYFIYSTDQPGAIDGAYDQEALKSYNAQTGKLVTIDKTDAQSINSDTFIKSTINNVDLLNNNLLYTKFWDRFGYYAPTTVLSGKTNTIYKVLADGSAKQAIKSFAATDWQWADSSVRNPYDIYFQLNGFDKDGQRKSSAYYEYTKGQVTAAKNVTGTVFNTSYPDYFLSPSGDHYFWTLADKGHTSLFISNQFNGQNQKVGEQDGYAAAGWYTDNYLLLNKDGHLYITGPDGGTPVKIN